MTVEKRLKTWVGAALFGLAASSAADAGDCYCWSSPRCWQYHRDVCFGHYQTNWRRWEDACGAPVKSPGDVTAGRVLHDGKQAASPWGAPPAPGAVQPVGRTAPVPAVAGGDQSPPPAGSTRRPNHETRSLVVPPTPAAVPGVATPGVAAISRP